jgi:hypothetical protein
MILLEYLRENELTLSQKGISAMTMAFKEVYPHTSMWIQHDEDGEYFVRKFLALDLPEEDCLKILQLTARYAGLWAFA